MKTPHLPAAATLYRVVVPIVGLVFAFGCANQSPQDTLERVRAENVVRIGYANEAPFAYRDTATGELTGEAPAIARLVAADLGIAQVEGVLTEFGALIPGLQAGRFDMIAAGMYITPERCTQVDFSEPTYSIGEAFIVATGNPKDLHGYDDIRESPDATIGVVTGAIQREYARATGIDNARVLAFPDAPAALAGVRAGRVDSYAATALTASTLLAKEPDGVERATPFHDPIIDGRPARGYGAFAVRKGDTVWLQAINDSLAGLIGTPEHAALVAPFGFSEDMRPGSTTARELCGAGTPAG